MSQQFVRDDLTVAANNCGAAPKTFKYKKADGTWGTKTFGSANWGYLGDGANGGVIASFDPSGDLKTKVDQAYSKIKGVPKGIGVLVAKMSTVEK